MDAQPQTKNSGAQTTEVGTAITPNTETDVKKPSMGSKISPYALPESEQEIIELPPRPSITPSPSGPPVPSSPYVSPSTNPSLSKEHYLHAIFVYPDDFGKEGNNIY